MVFGDTNVLLRSNPLDPIFHVASNALQGLRERQEVVCIAPQNLVEFWVVATRPKNVHGLGLDAATAAREILTLRDKFRLLSYSTEVFETWQALVRDLGVTGKLAHDAHLAAMMKVHSITTVLTFNGADFKRFPGITVLHPSEV